MESKKVFFRGSLGLFTSFVPAIGKIHLAVVKNPEPHDAVIVHGKSM